MFKSQFQGGPFVEVFSCQGKEPLTKWKLSGSSVQKIYEKEVKSYVFSLEGSSTTTKMQLPKDSKQTLALIQRYLVVQLNASTGAALSLELGILDNSNNKRRLLFSTAQKEISITPLHVKLPLLVLRRGMWLNLCLDLVSIIGEAFRGHAFKSLDSITLSASCKMRKIFTMKTQPQDSTDDDDLFDINPLTNSIETDVIPRSCQFPFDVVHQTQVITMSKLRHAEFKLRSDASRPPSSTESDLNSSMKSKSDGRMHIAFGTKVPVPQTPPSRKPSAGPREGSITSRSSGTHRGEPSNPGSLSSHKDGHNRQRSDPGSEVKDSSEKGSLLESKTWSSGVHHQEERVTHQPHPPRQKSADKSRRVVKVRPSSAKKEADSNKEQKQLVSSGNEFNKGGYDPKRFTSDTKGTNRGKDDYKWTGIEQNDGILNKNSKHLELRTSMEVKVTSHDEREIRSHKESESSEGMTVSESDGASDALANSFSKTGLHRRGESQSESDDLTNRVKGQRSKIPRRKKKSEKILSLMDSLSGNEEVQYDLRKIREERRENNQTDSGLVLTDSRTSLENISSLEDDEHIYSQTETSDKIRNEKQSTDGSSNLYTFMSPPRSAPNREMDRSSYLDQRTLQVKLLKIQESSLAASASNLQQDDTSVTCPNIGAKNSLDASLSDDTYQSISNKTPSPHLGQSSAPRELQTGSDTHIGLGHPSPVQSHSPKQSRSPTLRKWKLSGSGKGDQLSSHRKGDGLAGMEGLPRPVTSHVSPRGLGAVSRLSIHASKLKEIPKTDPRLSDDYDWRKYQSNSSSLASSLEAKMLASLKREQLEEMYEDENGPPVNNSFELHNYGDDDLSSSSDDTTTTFSTWNPPDLTNAGHKFQDEMHFPVSGNPLRQSNPRDWGNVFSPPIVLPSEKMKEELVEQLSPGKESLQGGGLRYQRQQSSTGSEGGRVGVGVGPGMNGEEELDLLYDPCLNCYFDPVTGKYYELA